MGYASVLCIDDSPHVLEYRKSRDEGMTSRKDIDTAIKRHDNAALRKMAQAAHKDETRMVLDLLADFVEQDLKKLKKTA
jgi:ribosomal protein S7